MATKIENMPSPYILMNSMRSIGYNFKTAIADIIDNSISAKAKNIYITTPISDERIFISILDDGNGMDASELFEAMRYGTGRNDYSNTDLGRFGLGLKSASLSQCKILTVASKKNNVISAFQWNLDVVEKTQKWDCLKLENNEISSIPNILDLENLQQGTLVIWENFDIALKKSDGNIRNFLSEEMDETEWHLRLVFHRFLNSHNKPLKIFINKNELKGFDPFLENHLKTDSQEPHNLAVGDSFITVQPFILPHQVDLSPNDIDLLGGIDSLRNGQGFYIYRNNRLIIYGTWFRLASKNVSSELYKYGRIKVDIPNTLDDMWEIDIKKQNATIPRSILNHLKNLVSSVCRKSESKTDKRARLTIEPNDNVIWNKAASKNKKDYFYVNTNSKFVKNILDDFEDKDKSKIIRLLEIVSASLPIDDIYNSICNKRNETIISDDIISTIILEGTNQFNILKKQTQFSDEKIFEIIGSFEPFRDEKILSKIKEEIKNGR